MPAAFVTSGYTLVDSEALSTLRANETLGLSAMQLTLLYMALEALTTTVALAGYLAMNRVERQSYRAVVRTGKWQPCSPG